MFKRALLIALAYAAALAQTDPKATISGTVRDAAGPVKDITVAVGGGTRNAIRAKTDASGRYTLRGVTPGSHRLSATPSVGPGESKWITVYAGQDMSSVDFHLKRLGQISGKVLDEDGEPLPGVRVNPLKRVYLLGAPQYVWAGRGTGTNDRGEYRLSGIMPGAAYYVYAEKRSLKLEAISNLSGMVNQRKSVHIPSAYPGGALDGSTPIILRDGENREGIDIRMSRSRSYCVEGVLDIGGRPAALVFEIGPPQPTTDGSGGPMPGRGTAERDGRFRVCDLSPGPYRITISNDTRVAGARLEQIYFGTSAVHIGDRDISDLRISAARGTPLSGSVVLSGSKPAQKVDATFSLQLYPAGRVPLNGEYEGLGAKSGIPGKFSLSGFFVGERYFVLQTDVPKGYYVEDIRYGGTSVLDGGFQFGSAFPNAELEIRLADNGGTVQVKVSDDEDRPIPHSFVVLASSEVRSEAALPDHWVIAETDQNAAWTSEMLSPGTYRLLATRERPTKNVDDVGRLWREIQRGKEIRVSEKGLQSVSLVLPPAR